MTNIKKIFLRNLLIIFFISFITIYPKTSFATDVKQTIKMDKLMLNKTSIQLKQNTSTKLNISVLPSNTTNKKVTWTSSNSKIATVTNKGVVKGIKTGTVTITAKAKDGSRKKATCKVKVVKEIKVNNITLNKKDLKLKVGTSKTIKATISPTNADNKQLIWTTSNSKIAKVKNGKITGLKSGTATITVKSKSAPNLKTSIKVKILEREVDLSLMQLSKANLNMLVGGTEKLSVKFNTSNNDYKQITWKSSDPNIVEISNTQSDTITLTAKKEGSTYISVTSKYGLTSICTVKVVKNKPLNISAGFTAKKYNGMKYYESIPENATENLPLIVFLHGNGEVNHFDKLKTMPIIQYVQSKEAYKAGNFIFIAPMRTTKEWSLSEEKPLMDLINKTVADYKIDKNRIILTGMSSGGMGTWSMASTHQNYFAAIVPMSAKTDFANASKLINLPIWGICGDTKNEEPERNRQMKELISKINKLNDNKELIKYEVIKGATHNTIQQYYKRQELFKWMLAQNKAQKVYRLSSERLIY